MNILDFASISTEEVAQRVVGLSPTQIKATIAKMSPEQVAAAFCVLDDNHTTDWSSKLRAALEGLSEYPKLEAAGKVLSSSQMLDLLNHFSHAEPTEHWKLSPLLVGLPHAIFKRVILAATPAHMQALKQEVINEPVQHQLTILTHEIVHHLPAATEQVTLLEQTIERLDLKDMGHKELSAIRSQIDQAAVYTRDTLDSMNKVLELAWNTNRGDIIDKLSQAKEICQRYFGSVIGHARTSMHQPTGLFAKLEERLQIAFGNPKDPDDIEAAENDEPALEALVKFSVWYLRDYWDIGLLPQVVDPQIFEPARGQHSEIHLQQLREKLFATVRHNLGKIGLNTVADLKEAGIFSRKTLEEYIQRHSYLLKT